MAFALSKLLQVPANALTGVGYLFKDNTHVAISRGGLTTETQGELRNIEYDGKTAMVAELDRYVFQGGSFSGTFLAMMVDSATFYPGSTTTTPGGNVSTLITPKESASLLVSADYLDNLRLYFPETGWQIRMPQAICLPVTLATADRNEGLFTATFEARQPLATAAGSAPGTAPFVIEKLAAFS
jgi:hypothetical protein